MSIAVLPVFATPSYLKVVKFLTAKDKQVINPIFEFLSLRAIQNIFNMYGYL